MLLAPGGSQARSPGRRWTVAVARMRPGVVAGGLKMVVASLVLVGGSRGCIDLLAVGK